MSDEDWAEYKFPIQCFRMGEEYGRESLQNLIGKLIDLSSDGSIKMCKKDIEEIMSKPSPLTERKTNG